MASAQTRSHMIISPPFAGREPGSPITICICGSGSLSHALVAVLGARPWISVRLLTRQPQRWSDRIRLIYLDRAELNGCLQRISSEPEEVIPGADLVILAVPHSARETVLKLLAPYLSPDTWLAGFPGYGGFAWEVQRVLGPEQPFMGLQRVPYVRKVISYGQVIWVSGIRPELFLGTVPAVYASRAAAWICAMLNIPTTPLAHYLGVCLSNSNPIFHPSRLYASWQTENRDLVWTQRPQFYEDWCDQSSAIYLTCDDELQAVRNAIPADLSASQTLLQHYRIDSREVMTSTIRGITALRDRPLPMRPIEGGWTPDLHTYYFTEDIPYGIVIQRAIAEAAGVATPMLDKIITWAEGWMGRRWLEDGRVASLGTDRLPIPQSLGQLSGLDMAQALR